jgi:diguanylate cyclase (GGDEF)-like protein
MEAYMKVSDLIKENAIIPQLYDLVRIINPVTKEILDTQLYGDFEERSLQLSEMKYCYEFWGDEGVCENCCSVRAVHEREIQMKTEFDGKDVFMVTSLPMAVDGNNHVFEAVVRITDKDILDEIRGKDYFEIKKILKRKNLEMVKDELTGTYNRKFINERLPFEIINAKNSGMPLAIAMADIDHFKNVNDTYGHDAGDEVLRQFSEILRSSIRENIDWIARYGGDEFIIFMKSIDEQQAVEKLEDIRKKVQTHVTEVNGHRIEITASFGLSMLNAGDSQEEWIKRADLNLYFSKENGRNMVSVNKESTNE